jgi:hypothetical protein
LSFPSAEYFRKPDRNLAIAPPRKHLRTFVRLQETESAYACAIGNTYCYDALQRCRESRALSVSRLRWDIDRASRLVHIPGQGALAQKKTSNGEARMGAPGINMIFRTATIATMQSFGTR